MQQAKAGEDGCVQGEALLARYPVIETANLDYHSHDCVALVARFEIAGRLLDVSSPISSPRRSAMRRANFR